MKQKPSNIKLSIGMIVKNEEKHLKNCLEALQPLMKQINCELIIADTGSTDRTVEIAKEYTDNVYHFEWCGDFSAARNSTLDRAKGEWYMFLDADEYFQDVKNLVKFFNSKEHKQYNSATYIIRSFVDPSHEMYQDIRGVRLSKRLPIVRFKGIVHEALLRVVPVKNLDLIVLHYGYAYKDPEERKLKQNRNMELLLKEYNEMPDKTRSILHICDVCEPEDLYRYLQEGMALIKDDPQNFFYAGMHTRMAKYLINNNRYQDAVDLTNEYFKARKVPKTTLDLDMLVYKSYANLNLKNIEPALDAMENYFVLYDRYVKGTIDTSDSIASVCQFANHTNWLEHMKNAFTCYAALGKNDKAFDLMKKIDFSDLNDDDFKVWLEDAFTVARRSNLYNRLCDFYLQLSSLPARREMFLEFLSKEYTEKILDRKAIAHAFKAVKSSDANEMLLFFKLTSMEGNNEEFFILLDNFAENLHNLSEPKSFYTDVIYWTVKYKRDITPFALNFSKEEVDAQLLTISATHPDFAEYILLYPEPKSFNDSLKCLYWLVTAYEKAILTMNNLDKNYRLALSYKFTEKLILYVSTLYNLENLDEENISVIPQIHRFGYFIALARAYLSEGDGLLYVQNLRKAFKSCEQMKDVVMLMIDNFKETLAKV